MRRPISLATPLLLIAMLLGSASVSAAVPGTRALADGSLAPAAPAGAASPPKCRYVDIATRYRALSEWSQTLVDTNLRVGKKYRPNDLVSVSTANIGGSGKVRALIIDDLRAMAAAARAAHSGIAVRSAYRSYKSQKAVFAGWVARSGYKQALLYSARPGHSEHQLGTTIDFRSSASSLPPWGYDDWATTKSGRWMLRNSWKYGFVESYPRGKTSVTCYGYEPWHFRYFGRTLAREIHDSGLTTREYLWKEFETAP